MTRTTLTPNTAWRKCSSSPARKTKRSSSSRNVSWRGRLSPLPPDSHPVIQARANTSIAPQPRSRSVVQPKKRQALAERDAERKLTKAVLADQMKQKMQALWDEVRMAEDAIGEGVDGALERFILAAGTMVENFRLARSNFDKNRVGSPHDQQEGWADDQGVIRVLKERPGKKHDLTSQALALQDRLERIMAGELRKRIV